MFCTAHENVNFEIETLAHSRHEGDVYPVIVPSADSDYPTPEYPTGFKHSPFKGDSVAPKLVHYDSLESSEDEEPAEADNIVHVHGADIGDLPTEYVVEGLLPDEFPVTGVYFAHQFIFLTEKN